MIFQAGTRRTSTGATGEVHHQSDAVTVEPGEAIQIPDDPAAALLESSAAGVQRFEEPPLELLTPHQVRALRKFAEEYQGALPRELGELFPTIPQKSPKS